MAESSMIIFGVRPVMEALEAGKQFERIFIKRGSDSPVIEQLKTLCDERRVALAEVPIEKLNRMTHGNHQGVVGQMSHIAYISFEDVLDIVATKSTPALLMVLDGVTDVRNFGAIARSAECSGVDAIIVSSKNGAPVNSDAIKSSAGALNIIPICKVGSIRTAVKQLSMNNMQIIAANEKSDAMLWNEDFTKPSVFVMGSEDLGVSKDILKMCDVQVAIPLTGKIGSLNVSVAAGVLLFEAVRQRKA